MSKWIIIALVIVGVLIVLYLIGKKSVHSELIISATKNQVWAVLMETDKTAEWNKVLIPVEGTLAEGNTIKYQFYQEEGGKMAEIPAKVKEMRTAELLNQGGGMPGILTFDHRYILEEVEGGTKVTIHEDYRGIMVPFWNSSPVEAAYERLNEQLKNRVESLNQGNE